MMNPVSVRVLFMSLACLAALSSSSTVQAQQATQASRFQYAAKFICLTNIPRTSATTTSVLPGAYLTVVNIHNPTNEASSFRKKLALTAQEGGQVSRFIDEKLTADQALKVDCGEIARKFGIQFIHGAEGFLVIESHVSPDVIAVYTDTLNVSPSESCTLRRPARKVWSARECTTPSNYQRKRNA